MVIKLDTEERRDFSFNEEDIWSNLTDISVGILLQSQDETGNGIW